MSEDATLQRLECQIGWYGKRSSTSQWCYKVLKIIVIAIAAAIPLLSGLPALAPSWVLGTLGAVIAVIEGIQQVNQYHANWISYRSTCEALKHEKYLYLGKAGPYAAAAHPHALLAEQVESLVSREHAKWASTQNAAETASAQPASSSVQRHEAT